MYCLVSCLRNEVYVMEPFVYLFSDFVDEFLNSLLQTPSYFFMIWYSHSFCVVRCNFSVRLFLHCYYCCVGISICCLFGFFLKCSFWKRNHIRYSFGTIRLYSVPYELLNCCCDWFEFSVVLFLYICMFIFRTVVYKF